MRLAPRTRGRQPRRARPEMPRAEFSGDTHVIGVRGSRKVRVYIFWRSRLVHLAQRASRVANFPRPCPVWCDLWRGVSHSLLHRLTRGKLLRVVRSVLRPNPGSVAGAALCIRRTSASSTPPCATPLHPPTRALLRRTEPLDRTTPGIPGPIDRISTASPAGFADLRPADALMPWALGHGTSP